MNGTRRNDNEEHVSLVNRISTISRYLIQVFHTKRSYDDTRKVVDTMMLAAALLLSIPVGGVERFSFVDWDALKELMDGCSSGYDNYYSYTNIQNRYKVNAHVLIFFSYKSINYGIFYLLCLQFYCLLGSVFGMMIILSTCVFAVFGTKSFIENNHVQVNVFIAYSSICLIGEVIMVIAIFEYVFEIFSHDSNSTCQNELKTFSLDKSMHLVGGIIGLGFPIFLFAGSSMNLNNDGTSTSISYHENADDRGIVLENRGGKTRT